jgi:hypothetical protein
MSTINTCGIFFHLVGALAATSDGEAAEGFQGRGEGLADVGMGDLKRDPAGAKRFLQKTGPVGLSMLDK